MAKKLGQRLSDEDDAINNYSAIVNPAVNDDTSQGYDIGSSWINVVNQTKFVCMNDAFGAAVWKQITDQSGGVYEPANANIQNHIASLHAPSNAQANANITKAEIEAKLIGLIATHTHAGGSSDPVYVLLTSGTLAMNFAVNDVVKITPSATQTFTTTVPAAGKTKTLIILTSGTTSRTITFGSGFKPTATLATGTVTNRVFVIHWTSDGVNLYESGRTAAMAA